MLLKKASAKAVSGLCVVRKVWYYQLDVDTWDQIRGGFTRALRAEDPLFWEQRKSAQFATLMRISEVQALPPIEVIKHDRRGWVVLRPRHQATLTLPSTAAAQTLTRYLRPRMQLSFVKSGDVGRSCTLRFQDRPTPQATMCDCSTKDNPYEVSSSHLWPDRKW